jgi:hypothetical protein
MRRQQLKNTHAHVIIGQFGTGTDDSIDVDTLT